MSDQLEPMPDFVQQLLKDSREEPPAGSMERMQQALAISIAALPVAAGVGAAAPAAVGGAAKILGSAGGLISMAALIAGVSGGVYLGRTVWAPEPKVQERVVYVEVPAVEKPAATPAVEAPTPQPLTPDEPVKDVPKRREPVKVAPAATVKPEEKTEKSAPPASRDEALAQEQQLLEMARIALLRRDATAALTALDQHAAKFPQGQLAEERESLAIQALVSQGQKRAAWDRAKRFEARFPHSMLKPNVENPAEDELSK